MKKDIVYLTDDVQLYKRPNSDNWYCRFSITGKGQQRKSLGTSNLVQAKKKAKDLYHTAYGRSQRGLAIDGYTFEHVANEFLQNYERRVSRGERKRKDLQNLTGVVTRYFIPYFDGQTIDEISEPEIEDYKEWRIDYWLTGPGKDIDKIYYIRNGHKLARPAEHKAPSSSRQNQELSMLRQIFKFAARKRYLDRRDLPEIKAGTVKNNQGAGLTEDEYQKLLKVSAARVFVDHPQRMRSRERIFIFIRIAACTGMRPTELYRMTWHDIENFEPYHPSDINTVNEQGLRVRGQIVDDGEIASLSETVADKDVVVHVRGKGKQRRAIPSAEISEWLTMVHDLWVREFDTPPEPHDPIFFGDDGEPIKSFKKGLTGLFEAADLLFDREGRRRTAYCFRHYYITQRLQHTEPYIVALNTGTSIDMISKTYSHAVPEMYADQLRKR